MSTYFDLIPAIAFNLSLAAFFFYLARRAKARTDKTFLAVVSLASMLDELRNRAAAPQSENDRQLAALIFLVQDNLSWARMAVISGNYHWAEKIIANASAEIAKRS
ncbi:hypothetical protein KBI23_23345 [bacterium]|nr:hypothetical protein [bacterium]MBP9809767.1 hypothetical protein [bacterium]